MKSSATILEASLKASLVLLRLRLPVAVRWPELPKSIEPFATETILASKVALSPKANVTPPLVPVEVTLPAARWLLPPSTPAPRLTELLVVTMLPVVALAPSPIVTVLFVRLVSPTVRLPRSK